MLIRFGRLERSGDSRTLCFWDKARITGSIVAEEIVVRGHVMGSVRGKRVMLQSSSHVEGDIFHDRIAIEEGARFVGASNNEKDEVAAHVRKLQQVAADASAKAG